MRLKRQVELPLDLQLEEHFVAGRGEAERRSHHDLPTREQPCVQQRSNVVLLLLGRIDIAAKNALAAIAEGDDLRMLLAALRRFTKYTPLNTSAIRNRLADKVVAAGGYLF